MDQPTIAGQALAHLHNAVNGFLADPDPTGAAWFLAADCLQVTHQFAEAGIAPDLVVTDLPPDQALGEAARLLDSLPRTIDWLPLWTAVQALRIRAGA